MEDFGFPSAHCANSITVPFYLLHYCYGRGYFDNVYWFAFCIFLGLFWTFSITFSRLYLGVHSPTDLMGGAILGITFLYGWLQFQDEFVVWLKASPFVPFVLALILFITISTHPSSTIPTLTFKHAVQMISVATGSAIGVWFRYNYPSYWSSVITLPESWKFNPSLLVHLDQYFGPQSTITITKLLLGFIALGVVKTLNQIFFNFFFSFTFKLPFISSFLHLSNRILSVLTIPHLKAANNLDYPNSNWSQLEEKMQEFQKKRKHEKEARDYDAFVMSLIISNFLSGWVITDFTRELFFITGLSSQL